jgi:hypothetical protein
MFEIALIGFHLFSAHIPNPAQLNNVNPGIYIVSQEGYTAGGYKNSYNKPSFYLGKATDLTPTIQATLTLTTGYNVSKRQITNRECNEADKNNGWNYCWDEVQTNSRGKITLVPSLSYAPVTASEYRPRITWVPGSFQVLHVSVERKF